MAQKAKSTARSRGKGTAMQKRTVLFVCTGNTCRSAMAESIFKQFLTKKRLGAKYRVVSAGLQAETGSDMPPAAKEALRMLGYKMRKHAAKQVTGATAQKADLIVCMSAWHKNALAAFGDKVKTMGEITGAHDVPDPYGMPVEVYKGVAEYLQYACDDILACLQGGDGVDAQKNEC